MELRHLRYFIGAAQDLSFTKTAKRLNVTQPLLSRQIRDLEEEVGVKLFARHREGVHLTDVGRVFLREACGVLSQADRALEAARQANSGEVGRLRVGIAWGLGDKVSRAVSHYRERRPGMELECNSIASGSQNEALRAHLIDVGFLRPFIDPIHLNSVFLFEERVFVLLPRSNPLAKLKKLRLKSIANETLLLTERSLCSSAYDAMFEIYNKAGIRPKIIPTTTLPHEEAGAILVASGKGIYWSVGSPPYHPAFADKITAVQLDEPGARVRVYMAWRKNESSPSVLQFVRSAKHDLSSKQLRSNSRGSFERP